MTVHATGRLIATPSGRDLVLTRHFPAPIEDVWASITESDRTARWFAAWEGEPGVGSRITLTLVAEEGQPTTAATIDACDPPTRLAISTVDEHGSWHLEATLAPVGDGTELTFVQHLDPEADPSEVGPGWEYYLDRLVAAEAGAPLPDFDSYFPRLQEHYRSAAAALADGQR